MMRYGQTPEMFSRRRSSPVSAMMYNVLRSVSPQAMLYGSSGPFMRTSCVPSGKMIQSPPGPIEYPFHF